MSLRRDEELFVGMADPSRVGWETQQEPPEGLTVPHDNPAVDAFRREELEKWKAARRQEANDFFQRSCVACE